VKNLGRRLFVKKNAKTKKVKKETLSPNIFSISYGASDNEIYVQMTLYQSQFNNLC